VDGSKHSSAAWSVSDELEHLCSCGSSLGKRADFPTAASVESRCSYIVRESRLSNWSPGSCKFEDLNCWLVANSIQMMMLVPMYFQVSAHATLTNAGAHLMPSVIGNAIGGLLAGFVIKRSGLSLPLEIFSLTPKIEPGDTSSSPSSAQLPPRHRTPS
jgi:hypothetical protein